jgi:hypothetical protein
LDSGRVTSCWRLGDVWLVFDGSDYASDSAFTFDEFSLTGSALKFFLASSV